MRYIIDPTLKYDGKIVGDTIMIHPSVPPENIGIMISLLIKRRAAG